MRREKDNKLFTLYIPVVLFLAAFIWKLTYIDHRDICNDEPFTIFHAQMSMIDIIKMSTENEPTPPLFMLLEHFWITLFGIGPLSARFLPLLFNALTVLFIYFAGKRSVSLPAGLLASGLFLFSNYHFFYGLEARTYSLVALATAASLYFFLRYSENIKDRKALAGLILSNIVLVYSHHFGWFVIFSQVLCGFFYARSLKMFFRLLIPPLATLVAFAPMVAVIVKQFISKTNRGTWLNPPRSREYLEQIYYFLNHKVVFWMIIAVLGVGLIYTLVIVFRKKRTGFNINILVLLLWWIIPYSIMFFVSSKLPMFNNRYILFNSIGLYLFIGAIISFLFQKDKYFEPVMGLAVLVFMFIYMRVLPDDFGYREVKNTVEFVKSHDSENRVVILFPYWSDFQFNYYYKPEIFKDPRNCYDLMKKESIYRVWGLPNTRHIVETNPGKRVIYIQGEPVKANEGDIFKFLDSAMVRVDSAFFPQVFHVGVYDPRPVD
jgi:uncharacterized membrane protein